MILCVAIKFSHKIEHLVHRSAKIFEAHAKALKRQAVKEKNGEK